MLCLPLSDFHGRFYLFFYYPFHKEVLPACHYW
nr:MAG TPA: hypothetical protein [Bacteriophage sp.]DAG85402.1 MAG TPA: hypothetical protein [Caudoviricetes sp.]